MKAMRNTTAVLILAVACSLGLTACGGSSASTALIDKIGKERTVVVGTKWDQPGIGLKVGRGEPQGFDIDVAKYLITQLASGQPVDIQWKESVSSNSSPFQLAATQS